MKYYIVVNNEKKGPYELKELANMGIKRDTLVWHSGMPQWQKASQLKELGKTLYDDNERPPEIPGPKKLTTQPKSGNVSGQAFAAQYIRREDREDKISKGWVMLPIVSLIFSVACFIITTGFHDIPYFWIDRSWRWMCLAFIIVSAILEIWAWLSQKFNMHFEWLKAVSGAACIISAAIYILAFFDISIKFW